MPSPQASGAVQVADIRTLALVGPAAAGKTSLAEAMLVKSGAIMSPGSLERGTTVSDHDPLERRVQHSLGSSVMHLHHAGVRLHFIDTPGAADFVGQSLPSLEAVETAAIVINAATGIEPMAVRMMEYAAERQLDRLIIVNKIDTQGVDLQALMSQIQATFGKECLPLNLPDANGSRVVDCFYNREGHSDFGSVDAAHRALVEQVVEVDAAFVDRYLNDGDVDAGELHAPLEQALREGHLIPVCFVSARSGAGVGELLDIVAKLLPNPRRHLRLAKVDELHPDAVLHDSHDEDYIHLERLPARAAVRPGAVGHQPQRRPEAGRVMMRLIEEDPCLTFEHDAGAQRGRAARPGDLHLRIALDRLRTASRSRSTRASAAHRVSRNGHQERRGSPPPQEADGRRRAVRRGLPARHAPRSRRGFVFRSEVVGGTIPTSYIPAVEKGVRQALARGVIAGYPVQDVEVVVYDGKSHPVDSKEVAFITAGKRAFMEAFMKAGPVVLEPIAEVEITAPGWWSRDKPRCPNLQATSRA
jgi:small GTP-binding protein